MSWNGLSFDFPVMAEESGLESECQLLSSRHVDMMFHVYCVKGQYLDLKTAATGNASDSPDPGLWLKGMRPRLWAEGKHRLVLDHLAENLRTTTDLALTCERRKVFLWINRRGSSQGMDLPSGLAYRAGSGEDQRNRSHPMAMGPLTNQSFSMIENSNPEWVDMSMEWYD